MHAGKLFTIVGGTAKHCIDQYIILVHYYAHWEATLISRESYTLGFAMHF